MGGKKCTEGGFCVLALLQFSDRLRSKWNVFHSEKTQITKVRKSSFLLPNSGKLITAAYCGLKINKCFRTCMLVIRNMMPPTAKRERAGKSRTARAKGERKTYQLQHLHSE